MPDAPRHDTSTLSPDDAFAVLGNETRMAIVRTLSEADEPLPFSDLYDRVDVDDSGQFNYHLNEVVVHFVRKTDDDEYELRQAGERVVEGVLSGAITDAAVLASTEIEGQCPYCGGTMEVSYRSERVLHRCTECPGAVGDGDPLPEGTIELGYLPPAAIANRSPEEIVDASATWAVPERVTMSNGICPRCGGGVDHELRVCEDHDHDAICGTCHRRHAVYVDSTCRTCSHEKGGVIVRLLMSDPRFRTFFETRGIDLFSLRFENWSALAVYDEEIVDMDPFRGRFTFTVDGEAATFTVDETLEVVEITHHGT